MTETGKMLYMSPYCRALRVRRIPMRFVCTGSTKSSCVSTANLDARVHCFEILRFLELNRDVFMFECSQGSLAVDVPEDVQRVEAALIKQQAYA